MKRRIGPAALIAAAVTLAPGFAHGQASGAIAGQVRDAVTGTGIAGVVVSIADGRRGAITDTTGRYRIREVRSGVYRVSTRAIGYGPVRRDSVLVRAGETTQIDFALQPVAVEVPPVVVEIAPDPVLDPRATATEQRITAEDLRRLPVSSLDEALALSAGAVGESYRGGRLGQQSFIIDGLGVKNQLDASTGALGLRLPPDILTEASLVTNGFSARYGQALSGLINVVTKDGGDRWTGRIAYETDRPLGGTADLGLDRVILQADGPVVGGIRALGAIDLAGRLDADPVNAPPATDLRDPRRDRPAPLPHNSGEQLSLAGKVTVPFGTRQTVRLFGLHTTDQRLLYDPLFKYDPSGGPARRLTGTLGSAHLQHTSSPEAALPLVADLRVGYFVRDFVRGTLVDEPDYAIGAFTGSRFRFVGEGLARAGDTVAARAPIPGLARPTLSDRTPWGVPAFFFGGGSRGELAWNQFRELRAQLDVTLGIGSQGDVYLGGEIVSQRVRAFQRVLGYLPVGDTVPPATASAFDPLAAALYAETQFRTAELGFTAGIRYDRFDARADLPDAGGAKQRLNPRIAVSTVLKGATIVASIGSFSQAPDYQYLVDAAFDDTTRTGRFRQGNANLGFEQSWQYELSVRGRLTGATSLRVNTYVKRLEGLVASVPLGADPDSTIFGNSDAGTVRGGDIIFEREMVDWWGLRLAYTLQAANATSTSAFLLRRSIRIDTLTGDTIVPAKVEFPLDFDRRHSVTMVLQSRVPDGAGPRLLGVRPLAGLEAAVIGRLNSGLPYTRLSDSPDSLLGPPNDSRLPATSTIDLLLRRPFDLGGARAGVYLDVRNLFNRRNIVAVRRDTGTPTLDEPGVAERAEDAYAAHPETIPFESPRYRTEADLDRDGDIEGRAELLPMFLAAARDFTHPLFAYGPPRLVRVGVEVVF